MVAIRSKDRAMARAAVSATTGGSAAKPALGTLVELLLPLLVLGLLIALCIQLLLPFVGQKAYAAWSQASADTPAFMKKFGPQLASFTKWMVAQAGGTMMAILMLVLAVIFAAITLAYAESARAFCRSLLARITGSKARG